MDTEKVEARQENCRGVNLDLCLWLIPELFVSFFCSTSAAQSVGTGRTAWMVGGGGLQRLQINQMLPEI